MTDRTPDAPTDDDLRALRTQFYVPLDRCTDDELRAALAGAGPLLQLGRRWGWNDTEARDQVADLLERHFGVAEIEDLATR